MVQHCRLIAESRCFVNKVKATMQACLGMCFQSKTCCAGSQLVLLKVTKGLVLSYLNVMSIWLQAFHCFSPKTALFYLGVSRSSDYTSTVTGAPPPLPASNPDWVVVLGVAPDRKDFVEKLELERKLKEAFPPERVHVYRESTLNVPQRKELLNKARLMVSVHDNLLSDMIFMPPGGAIFEIRPIEDPDPTFHLLAEVCDLKYHLLFCEGYRKALPRMQASAKLKIKDQKAVDKLIIKLGKRLQTEPTAESKAE